MHTPELGYQTGLGFGQTLASAKPRSRGQTDLSAAQRPTLSRESTRRRDQQRREKQDGIQPLVAATELGRREEVLMAMPIIAPNGVREAGHLRGMRSRTLSVAGKTTVVTVYK